jgi:hypothetical protein
MALSLVASVPLASVFSAANILTGASLLELLAGLIAAILLTQIQRPPQASFTPSD